MAQAKPQSDSRLIGNWEFDRERTLAHRKPRKFRSRKEFEDFESSLAQHSVQWTDEECHERNQNAIWSADYELVSAGKSTIVIRLWLASGASRLQKIYLDGDYYWIANGKTRDYFKRIDGKPSATRNRKGTVQAKSGTRIFRHRPEVTPLPEIQYFSKAKRISIGKSLIRDLGSPLTITDEDDDLKPASLIDYELPEFWLPSGRVCASELAFNVKPFTREIKPGHYPLRLVVSKFAGNETIAFAILQFAEKPVAKWEMAAKKGQDAAKLKGGRIFAYSVDSGIGSFCDSSAAELLDFPRADLRQWGSLLDRFWSEMQKACKPARQWVRMDTVKGSAALFTSGQGDGVYASYFGLDKAGRPVALMTDFEIVSWPRIPVYA